MDDAQALPESFRKATHSLAPYLKQRQQAAQIRRILASHLISHVSPKADHSLSRPISLLDTSCNVDPAPHGVRGLQKEYLRCVQTNVRAQKDYAKISKEHRLERNDEDARVLAEALPGNTSSVNSFVELVDQRQKHERLRIVQDYLDVLAQKPAATVEHSNAQMVLQDVGALPKMPLEVLNGSSLTRGSSRVDLKDLVDQLEKSVLRAKMLLRREQDLLSKVKAENASSPSSCGSRLEAVGLTRSALINWIEAELSRAGESSPESQVPGSTSPDKRGKQFVDFELSSIHKQYARYTKARQSLIHAATGTLNPPATIETTNDDPSAVEEESYASTGNEVTYPFMERMVLVSSEQKAMVQQKSHLTFCLSKQLQEANQGLDRLADESHLLPAHPLPLAKKKRFSLDGPVSFGDEISNQEEPSSSLRARSWVHATQSACEGTKAVVSEKLDEGNKALIEAQQTLLELNTLLGVTEVGREDGSAETAITGKRKDIWAAIDGNLGVIQGGQLE